MTKSGLFSRAALTGLLTSIGLLVASAGAHAQIGPEVPTAEDFGRLPLLSSLSISPDGKHLAAVTSSDGKATRIMIWDTSDLSKPASIATGDDVRFMSVVFVKNNRLAVTTRELFDMGLKRGFGFPTTFTDLTGAKWFKGANVVAYLPNDPENILVRGTDGAINKYDLTTGKSSLSERIVDADGNLIYDDKGELRAKSRVNDDHGKIYITQLLKNPETGVWEEHFRGYAKDREIPAVVALTKDPNIILVAARRGKDHTAIYDYDIKARAFKDVAFEHPLFDAKSVSVNHRTGEVMAFTYLADRPTTYYLDDHLDATMTSIGQALGIKTEEVAWTDLATGKNVKFKVPDGASLSLIDYSDDYKSLIVERVGSATPEEYYLYIEGKGLIPLGAARPYLNTRLLGEGHLKQFTARDGRPVPAFVFTPNVEKYGKGPYPTLIIPHGGPWARDYLDWDAGTPWVQYFVARGFAVAEPQYRGSDGWGYAQWTAGDNKWGQEMSDDMDDVALGMVKQGIADRNRLAMHGYSFGGYSAMAAIVRSNPIYQCAISGAGPASPAAMQEETRESPFAREFQRPFVGGLDARAEADKASIPILIYHGDRDENVQPEESQAFYRALQAVHKPSWRVEIKGMGHEANKWTPANAIQILTMVDTFLKTDCKAGGL